MPELPTREELAQVIHDASYRWEVFGERGGPDDGLDLVTADAVLHLLMRDADTEWALRFEDGEMVTRSTPEAAWASQAKRAKFSALPQPTVISRRSVTFTGEWEPAG